MILICEFLDAMYTWKPSTLTTAKRHLNIWNSWLGGKNLSEVTISDFDHWTSNNGWSLSMAYNSLWAIKRYLKWLNIDHALRKHTVKRKLTDVRFLSLQEVETLINACDLDTPKGLQDATITAFLWGTWLRADGIITAEVDCLNFNEQTIQVSVKGGVLHKPAFDLDAKDLLEMWLPVRENIARKDTKTLFINIRRGTPLAYSGLWEILNNLGEKTKIEKVTPHAFRRGAMRKHAEDGHPPRQALEQAGHKSFDMYWRYTRGVNLDSIKKKRWRKNGKGNQNE